MKDEDKSKEQLIKELIEMRKQARFYKNVLDQLSVCTIAYDQSERAIYRNKQSKTIDGYDDEQMLGLSREEYLSRLQIKPGKISKLTYQQHTGDNFRDGIYSLNETSLLTKEGNPKNVLLTGNFIYDDENNFVCACGCALDISSYIDEIKRGERSLREQLHFMQLLIDTIPNPVFYKDIKGLFLGCNKAFGEFIGLTKENIIGKTVYEVYPPDLAVKFHQTDAALFSAPGIQIYEHFFPYADGTRRNVILNKATYADRNGVTAGLVGVAIDITQRKQMEEALRLSEERFSKAFYASPALMLVTPLESEKIILVNDSFLRHTGYSRPEIIGRKSTELNIWDDAREPYKLKKAIIKNGLIDNYEINFRTKSGELRTALICMDVIELNHENCVLIAASDITERKQFEKEMARLDRLNLVGEMAAALGHEVRNPITTIRGFLQLLGNKKELSSYREYFDLMIDELDRANSIITEFLSLAKDKAIDLKERNLNHILAAMFPLIQSDSTKAGKYVHMELGDIPVLLLDEKEIRQVILNLVRNGLEAMPPGGRLMIKTYPDNSEIILAVQDHGNGMPPRVLEKIGTPFFTTKENGTGLGLAVCYSIAARHNARIDVKTGPAGTTFQVIFKRPKNGHDFLNTTPK